MRRIFLIVLMICSVTSSALPWAVRRPKLVVVIVIDQFRADYISRFQHLFNKNGFNALLKEGAYFPYGEYDVLQAMTGPGHATILTGAYPYQMGIPLNDWYDQKTHGRVYCVDDPETKSIGTGKVSASPKNLVGSTLGDELKNADLPTRVVALALKDRAAVLLGGHRADLALWLEHDSQIWTTSTYYRKDGKLPSWMDSLNRKVSARTCNLTEVCGIEMTTEAFKAALEGESLGQTKSNDLIAVSFSSHDFAGHKYGPNAEEMKVMTLAEDNAIAAMREAVQRKVLGGLKDVVFVLTGDHGVAPKPEYLADTGIETGHINESNLAKDMNESLNKKYGAPKRGSWVSYVIDFNFFVDEDLIREAKLDIRRVENDMKEVATRHPGFAHVFTRGEYEMHQLPPGMFERKVSRTFYRGRSGNVIGIQKPFYINDAKKEANHMSGYVYDRMVPILFSGFGVKNGVFADKAEVVDIAPTLAFLMGVLPPALSEGHVLTQALKTTTSESH